MAGRPHGSVHSRKISSNDIKRRLEVGSPCSSDNRVSWLLFRMDATAVAFGSYVKLAELDCI